MMRSTLRTTGVCGLGIGECDDIDITTCVKSY